MPGRWRDDVYIRWNTGVTTHNQSLVNSVKSLVGNYVSSHFFLVKWKMAPGLLEKTRLNLLQGTTFHHVGTGVLWMSGPTGPNFLRPCERWQTNISHRENLRQPDAKPYIGEWLDKISAPVNIIYTYLKNDGIHEPKLKLVGRFCPSTGPVATGKTDSPQQRLPERQGTTTANSVFSLSLA